ncbi:MAG: ATP-dependent zinc metalloprotease FtsH [Myxococcales bacterium]|nr:ATP-dependent zinc metalloprotease FtsH [Myxococcales bacterium]
MPEKPRSSKRPSAPDAPPAFRGSIVLLVFLGLSLAMLWTMSRTLDRDAIRYDQFKRYLRDGRIESVQVGQSEINGRFREGKEPPAEVGDKAQDGKKRSLYFRLQRVDDEGLIAEFEERGVEYSGLEEADGSYWPFLMYLGLGVMLFMLLTGTLARGGRGGGPANVLAFGKSRGKVFQETDVEVSFKDVAGIDEAKAELQEIIDFLRRPERYHGLGAKIPKGVLLVGPPGTGKTLLARAVAGEAGVPFISINGSEFVEMFVGVGASRVRDLFEQAGKAAPCIVFIDELDAIGRTRNGVSVGGGSNEEREQTLNQLLVELDGFEPHKAVIIMSATNRPEVLDPALLRPGRFDRQILVDRPDRRGREEILQVHVGHVPLDADVELGAIAAQTPGFAGADLANLVNEAALAAARRGATKVASEDFSRAIDRVVAGLERKSRLINDEEKRRIAVHEIGHALAAKCSGSHTRVQKISIIPHGMAALGYTRKSPEEERQLMTESMLRCELTSLLGGRSAEQLVFGEVSTGASNDLQQATDIARAMVVEYGMSPAVGPLSLRRPVGSPFLGAMDPGLRGAHGDAMADRVDAEVRRLVDEAQTRAVAILKHNRRQLDAMAERLIEHEQLEGELLEALMAEVSPPPGGAVMTAPGALRSS